MRLINPKNPNILKKRKENGTEISGQVWKELFFMEFSL